MPGFCEHGEGVRGLLAESRTLSGRTLALRQGAAGVGAGQSLLCLISFPCAVQQFAAEMASLCVVTLNLFSPLGLLPLNVLFRTDGTFRMSRSLRSSLPLTLNSAA